MSRIFIVAFRLRGREEYVELIVYSVIFFFIYHDPAISLDGFNTHLHQFIFKPGFAKVRGVAPWIFEDTWASCFRRSGCLPMTRILKKCSELGNRSNILIDG